jgi:hypothetical protein
VLKNGFGVGVGVGDGVLVGVGDAVTVGDGSTTAVGGAATLVKVGFGVRVGTLLWGPLPELQAPSVMALASSSNTVARRPRERASTAVFDVGMTSFVNLPVLGWATL